MSHPIILTICDLGITHDGLCDDGKCVSTCSPLHITACGDELLRTESKQTALCILITDHRNVSFSFENVTRSISLKLKHKWRQGRRREVSGQYWLKTIYLRNNTQVKGKKAIISRSCEQPLSQKKTPFFTIRMLACW